MTMHRWILIAISALCISTAHAKPKTPLKLIIHAKSSHVLGGEFKVRVELRNIGSEQISVFGLEGGANEYIRFKIDRRLGKQVSKIRRTRRPPKLHFLKSRIKTLAPGESSFGIISLDKRFKFERAAQYRITARYLCIPDTEMAWFGILESALVESKLSKPK